MMRVFSIICLLFAMFSCNPKMPPRHRQYVMEKAPGDLHCESERIKMHSLPDGEYEVVGCGAKAAYRVQCNELGECEAIMTKVAVPVREHPEDGEE